MLNDWSHKVRAILKKYCPGNIKKILPYLSQSEWNTRFYFGHQKLCMDDNIIYYHQNNNSYDYCTCIFKIYINRYDVAMFTL